MEMKFENNYYETVKKGGRMFIDSHTHGDHAERNSAGNLVQPLMTAWVSGKMTPQEMMMDFHVRFMERLKVPEKLRQKVWRDNILALTGCHEIIKQSVVNIK